MAINEHYSLKLFGTVLGQAFLNTFAYRQFADVGGNYADDLASIFDTFILTHLAGAVGTYVGFDRIEAFSIEDPGDFKDRSPNQATGLRAIATTGQPPSYTAFGTRSNRAGAGSRASYKRFVGMAEDDSDGNTLTATFLALAAVVSLIANLGDPLVHVSGNSWVPVQLKAGWLLGVPPIENFVINAYGIPYLTSQVSRRA